MIVKSRRPIIVTGNSGNGFSSFDANGKPTNEAETKFFQNWLDLNKPGWNLLFGTINKDVKKGYGVYPWTPATDSAWTKHGTEFVNFGRGLATNIYQATTSDPTGQTKQGQFWDKAKGMWVKAKDYGIVDAFGNLLFNKNQQQQQWQGETQQQQTLPPPPPKEKIKGTTIALIVVGVVGVGALLYFMTKSDAVAPTPTK